MKREEKEPGPEEKAIRKAKAEEAIRKFLEANPSKRPRDIPDLDNDPDGMLDDFSLFHD